MGTPQRTTAQFTDELEPSSKSSNSDLLVWFDAVR